jgi:hypothetical protein
MMVLVGSLALAQDVLGNVQPGSPFLGGDGWTPAATGGWDRPAMIAGVQGDLHVDTCGGTASSITFRVTYSGSVGCPAGLEVGPPGSNPPSPEADARLAFQALAVALESSGWVLAGPETSGVVQIGGGTPSVTLRTYQRAAVRRELGLYLDVHPGAGGGTCKLHATTQLQTPHGPCSEGR